MLPDYGVHAYPCLPELDTFQLKSIKVIDLDLMISVMVRQMQFESPAYCIIYYKYVNHEYENKKNKNNVCDYICCTNGCSSF